MATCSLSELLSSSACFASVPKGMRDILRLQLLCQIVNGESVAECDIQTLLDDAACFAAVPQGTRDILELQLLCEISEGGGGGGSGGITRGEGSPEGVVTGGNGAGEYLGYIDTLTCEFYKFGGVAGANTGWC